GTHGLHAQAPHHPERDDASSNSLADMLYILTGKTVAEPVEGRAAPQRLFDTGMAVADHCPQATK
ncbi:MAG: hypothetical protein MUP14_02225, partial [Dehalococcoidia bacterium]|nr:hypothetical protein [Dehalococcoidia bacterium]